MFDALSSNSSYGTFGFWTAYLAQGDAIMANGFSTKQPYLIGSIAKAKVPGWTTLNDPCYNVTNGKIELTEECDKHRKEYGISDALSKI